MLVGYAVGCGVGAYLTVRFLFPLVDRLIKD